MSEERRIEDLNRHCPQHDILYRARQDEMLICCAWKCDWTIPARREIDQEIPTMGQLKRVYNGG